MKKKTIFKTVVRTVWGYTEIFPKEFWTTSQNERFRSIVKKMKENTCVGFNELKKFNSMGDLIHS